MELKEGELKVYYQGDLDPELDEALRKVLRPFGYKEWVSGYFFEGKVWDTEYCKEGKLVEG